MLCNSQKDDEIIAYKMFECIEIVTKREMFVCKKKKEKKRFGVNMIFFKKLNILFSKDTLNWPKVTVNVPKNVKC